MSKTKRTPIQYPSTFGEGILRPRDVVEAELAAMDDAPALAQAEPERDSPTPLPTPIGPAVLRNGTGGKEEKRGSSLEESRKVGNEEKRKSGMEESRKVGNEPVMPTPTHSEELELFNKVGIRLYDLNVKPHRKDSFFFTDEEFFELSKVKLELKEEHGLALNKDDIARCALLYLLHDYREHGEQSVLVRILRERRRK